MLAPSVNNHVNAIEAFASTLRYLGDLLEMSDHCIEQMVIQIYFTALH